VQQHSHKVDASKGRVSLMYLRGTEARLPTLFPVQIAGLENLHLQTGGRILDISPQGIRLGVLEAIPVGSHLRLELDGSIVHCRVSDCRDQKTWFDVGLVFQWTAGASGPIAK